MLRELRFGTVFLCVFFSSSVCVAQPIIVDPARGGNHRNIQRAIDDARDGDTVLVRRGEYRITSSITFRGKRITVKAENGPEETVIRMTGGDPVVRFDNGEGPDSRLEGFTLTGTVYRFGAESAGVFCLSSAPTLENCTITGNSGWYGGAVRCKASSPSLRRCTITGNSAQEGGAVYCQNASSPTLTGCTITGNSAASGAVYTPRNSSATLINCIVWANPGGSFHQDGGIATVLYSCVEAADVWPGEGNINEDPLFCAWETDEVDVADRRGFKQALEASEFSLKLSQQSPCLGSGEGGVDMGAPSGTCEAAGEPSRLIRLPPGLYRMDGLNLAQNVSIEGAGQEETVLEGTVFGLRTEARLSRLTVRGGTIGGIFVSAGEEPQIQDASITGNRYAGVACFDSSSPRFTNCFIARNSKGEGSLFDWPGGVYLRGSSPTLENCTIVANTGGGVNGGSEGFQRIDSFPTLVNCILWDNPGGSINQDAIATAIFSCIEGADVWPGEGNINQDPLFCGWANEVLVTDSNGLREALDPSSFSFELSRESPCLGTGEGGADMGAGTGFCDRTPNGTRQIRLAGGSYTVGVLDLSHNVSLLGAGAEGTEIVGAISGLRTGAVLSDVTVNGGGADGISVLSGEAPEILRCRINGFNRGVMCTGSSPTLRDCMISGNSIAGVMCTADASPTLISCVISGNGRRDQGHLWGGLSLMGGAATLTDCVISGNFPGVSCVASSPTLTSCTITGNSTNRDGAGVNCTRGSAPTLEHCTIMGNSADGNGGGVFCGDNFGGLVSSATLTDCVLAQNTAALGGGLFADASFATLTRCTVVENSASQGGGLYGQNGSALTVLSSIAWDNAGGSIVVTDPQDIADVTFSCIEGAHLWPGTGNINAYPLFCGWSGPPVVYVDRTQPGPGDGTEANPYPDLEAALDDHDYNGFALSRESPCFGTGEGGVNMGADKGICEEVVPARLVHLKAGTYSAPDLRSLHAVSLRGEDRETTILEGTLFGPRSGAVLENLKVTGARREGIRVPSGESPEIRAVTIAWNSRGAVVCEESSSPRFINCVIAGNSRSGSGGIVDVTDASPSFLNCTIAENSTTRGVGLRLQGNSAALLMNSILWGNAPGSIALSSRSTLEATYSLIEGEELWPGEGNLNEDPHFVGEGDYHLERGSPAIDAGTEAEAPPTDIDGNTRPCGNALDMGAYEYCDEAPPPPRFRRGDCNSDGQVQLADAVFLLRYSFTGGAVPRCRSACDADGDSRLGVSDAVYLLNFNFGGGPSPAAPFPGCGPGGALGCESPTEGCQ